MVIVSITRLRLRSALFLPRFLWRNERVVRQIVRSPGFREGKLLFDARLTFWTMTSWDDEASMRAYRDAGAHRAAMPKMAPWCDEASTVQFPDRADLPTWDEAHAQILSRGRASKLRHPSPQHSSLNFPPIRWRSFARNLVSVGGR